MASTAGGSGAGGGDRCPSGEKGTTRVGRRSKKPSAFHRASLRYFEKEYRECMTRGEEPPFDREDLLRRYGSSPSNSEVSAPPSSSAPARNPLEHSAFQCKDGTQNALTDFLLAQKKSVRAFCVPTQGRLKTYVLKRRM